MKLDHEPLAVFHNTAVHSKLGPPRYHDTRTKDAARYRRSLQNPMLHANSSMPSAASRFVTYVLLSWYTLYFTLKRAGHARILGRVLGHEICCCARYTAIHQVNGKQKVAAETNGKKMHHLRQRLRTRT